MQSVVVLAWQQRRDGAAIHRVAVGERERETARQKRFSHDVHPQTRGLLHLECDQNESHHHAYYVRGCGLPPPERPRPTVQRFDLRKPNASGAARKATLGAEERQQGGGAVLPGSDFDKLACSNRGKLPRRKLAEELKRHLVVVGELRELTTGGAIIWWDF